MSRVDLYGMFAEKGFKIGCEVGVHAGKNAVEMFKKIPGLKLFLVEPYKDHPNSIDKWGEYNSHELARTNAHTRMKGYDAIWIEDFSEDAVKRFKDESLDYVYIDANHSYNFVMLDNILWARKVRVGGIVSGHDFEYNGRYEPKVTRAVIDYTQAYNIPLYYTESPQDRKGSWYFVKE